MTARVQVPGQIRRGEVIEIRVIIQHPMETGYRHDETGTAIARNTIRSVVCRYDGVEIFRAETSSGIAANPYFLFTTVAESAGTLQFDWVDDAGVEESYRVPIVLAN